MKRPIKIISIVLVLGVAIAAIVALLLNVNRYRRPDNGYINIVTTNFPSYDFARAVAGENANIKMLVQPGSNIHDYEPTPQDIVEITNSDLFICTGGESDSWLTQILRTVDTSKIYKISEHVSNETDKEHPWTSIPNSIEIVAGISALLSSIRPEYSLYFEENANAYITRLSTVHQNFKNLFEQNPDYTLVFADRFPFANFVADYNVKYLSPYTSCDEHSESNPQIISQIIDFVRQNSVRYIFKIELTSEDLARTIANDTGAEILTFHSGHNISAEDFESGKTYADLLEQNFSNLEKALE